MRTPIELACFYWASEEIEIEDFIEQIQNEAWNEAIEMAVSVVKYNQKTNKDLILKLKK